MTTLKIFLIEWWYSRGRNDSDLARSLGVDHSLVSRWVSGKEEPTLERKIQIAKTIGVDSRLVFPEKRV